MRVGMVTLRVRNLDLVTDYYRDVIGLTVMARSVMGALLGAGGVRCCTCSAAKARRARRATPRGSITPRS